MLKPRNDSGLFCMQNYKFLLPKSKTAYFYQVGKNYRNIPFFSPCPNLYIVTSINYFSPAYIWP